MGCKYARQTGKPWFINKPTGAKTVRCYFPAAQEAGVAGGLLRLATKGDTFDVKRPVAEQIIPGADYVSVRSCVCGRARCKYYEEEANE